MLITFCHSRACPLASVNQYSRFVSTVCCLCVIWFVYLHRHGGSGRGSDGYAGYPARTQDKCGRARNVEHKGTICSSEPQVFALVLSSRCSEQDSRSCNCAFDCDAVWVACKYRNWCVWLQMAPCDINKGVIATNLPCWFPVIRYDKHKPEESLIEKKGWFAVKWTAIIIELALELSS